MQGGEAVVHLQKQGQLAKPRPGFGRKICIACEAPIAVYGRILPCWHTFCQPCAANMAVCAICDGPVSSIEFIRHGEQPLFVSAATLQSFKSATAVSRARSATARTALLRALRFAPARGRMCRAGCCRRFAHGAALVPQCNHLAKFATCANCSASYPRARVGGQMRASLTRPALRRRGGVQGKYTGDLGPVLPVRASAGACRSATEGSRADMMRDVLPRRGVAMHRRPVRGGLFIKQPSICGFEAKRRRGSATCVAAQLRECSLESRSDCAIAHCGAAVTTGCSLSVGTHSPRCANLHVQRTPPVRSITFSSLPISIARAARAEQCPQ